MAAVAALSPSPVAVASLSAGNSIAASSRTVRFGPCAAGLARSTSGYGTSRRATFVVRAAEETSTANFDSEKLIADAKEKVDVYPGVEAPTAKPTVADAGLKGSSDNSVAWESANFDSEELLANLKEKFDKLENKPLIALYVGGGVLVTWLLNAVVGAVDSLPLIPKFLELVGFGYSTYFVYRYLLFKSSRQELVEIIEDFKSKISGTSE